MAIVLIALETVSVLAKDVLEPSLMFANFSPHDQHLKVHQEYTTFFSNH